MLAASPERAERKEKMDRWLWNEDICSGHECICDCDNCVWADKVINENLDEIVKVTRDIEDELAEIEPEPQWIPCSERLPEDMRPVFVTWKNNDPKSYYQYIVGKHFIGVAHYHRGKWYWYSSVTEDLLAEYGKCDFEEFDEAIEAIAWMPLPEPYKGGEQQ